MEQLSSYLVHIRRSHCCDFHSIAKIDKIFICSFLLFCDQTIPAVNCKNIGSKDSMNTEVHPLIPIVKPSPSLKGTLNKDRFGTSWKRIWDRRSSMREMEMDSGKTEESSCNSSSSPRFVGSKTD